MEVVAKALDDLIDALYRQDEGIDEDAHDALLELVYQFESATSDEKEARRRCHNLNMRVDATDGRFYFGG